MKCVGVRIRGLELEIHEAVEDRFAVSFYFRREIITCARIAERQDDVGRGNRGTRRSRCSRSGESELVGTHIRGLGTINQIKNCTRGPLVTGEYGPGIQDLNSSGRIPNKLVGLIGCSLLGRETTRHRAVESQPTLNGLHLA